MAIHTRSFHRATSQGEERLTARAAPRVGSPGLRCLPVPARVVTSPVPGSYRRRAWFTVSATTTEPSPSRASPCGSLNSALSAGPSVKPRLPVPIRRTGLSPSSASSTS